MTQLWERIAAFVSANPAGAAVLGGFALISLGIVLLALRALYRKLARLFRTYVAPRPAEDVLTIAVAAIATGVSAQGMWRFSEDVLGLDGPLRVLLFAFIELAIMTSAVRAKRNMRENLSAGIDGIAVWALAALTAVLSAMEALLREGAGISTGTRVAEFVFRLAAPLVAAWLWERGMAIERVRITGRTRIHWRLTPERAMVRLGLAEASDRTASQVDAHRRVTRVSLAAKRARVLEAAGAKPKKIAKAYARLDRRVDQMIEHTDLTRDPALQHLLLDQTTTLAGAGTLVRLPATPVWAHLDHPAVTGAARHSDALRLADSMDRWTAIHQQEGDPETSAVIRSMAAYISRRHLDGSPAVTDTVTPPSLTDQLTPGLTVDEAEQELAEIIAELGDGNPVTPPVSDPVTPRATDAMRRHWDHVISTEQRIPNGVELSKAAGCAESWGRTKRAEWEAALTPRDRRRLTKKASA